MTNEVRGREILLAEKWRKFLSYRPLFSLVPFLDFAITAGSLVFGKVHKNSDFDVILGARTGRIFTVRFFCFLIFGLAGARRKKLDHKETASDKICLNHFVTSKSYKLQPLYNIYWEKLYQNLAPIYGKEESVQNFFKANEFLTKGATTNFKKFQSARFNLFRFFWEFILGGVFGDLVEKFLKQIQMRRIKKTLAINGVGFAPRLRFDDDELEFHPDTSRIESFLN